MVKHCLSKIVLIAILLLATTTQAFAQTTPAPSQSVQFNLNDVASNDNDSVTQKNPDTIPVALSIQVSSSDNNKIKGTLNFQNDFLDDIPNVYYNVVLFPTKTAANISGTVSYAVSKPIYTVKSKTTQSMPFELDYSPNIPSGDYQIQAIVGTPNKPSLANASEPVVLQGNGTYLSIELNSCFVISNKTEYDQTIAPPFNPNEVPQAKCTVVNPFNRAVTALIDTDYAVRNIGNPTSTITQTKNTTPIIFQPNQKREVTFALPALATPQVYQSFVTFVDANNNDLSVNIPFRWTVTGESGYISLVKLNNTSYQKGDTAQVSVTVSPSMDLFWKKTLGIGTELPQAVLSATITDKNGAVCGTKDQQLPKLDENQSIWPVQIINLPITQTCVDPKIAVKLTSQSKTLAEKSVQILTPPQPQTSSLIPQPWLYVALGASIILLIIVIVAFFILRKKRKPTEPLVPPTPPQTVALLVFGSALFIASTFFMHQAFAAATTYPYDYSRSQQSLYYSKWFDGSAGDDGSDAGEERDIDVTALLWVNEPSQNHDSILQGNPWTNGSKVRTLNDTTLEVTFFGDVFDYTCDNYTAGFLLASSLNNSTDAVEISNLQMLTPGSASTSTRTIYSGSSIVSPGVGNLGPTDINVTRQNGGGIGNSIGIKFEVKKKTGVIGPQDVFNLNMNLYLAVSPYADSARYYSSANSNRPVKNRAGNDVYCGGNNPGCMARADIPIPGGYLEGANGASCTVTGWARLPATQYPSSGPKQTDVEIWNMNTLTRVKRFTTNVSRTLFDETTAGNFGFSESLNGLLANNQQYNLGLYAVVGDGSDKLYTALLPENSSVNNPITLTCTGTTGTPTPTPTPGKTTCITPGLSTTPRIDPLEDILRVDASREGKGAGPGVKATYGVSGLNAGDPNLTPGIVSGDNYYNTLKIQPIFTSNERDLNQLSLIGSAFTGTGGNAPAGSTLRDLINSAQNGNGFVVVYANKTTDEAGFHFDAFKYYIIYNNTLTELPSNNNFKNITAPDGTTIVMSAAKGIGTQKTPWAPSFDIRLYQPLGNRVWGTYMYLKYGSTSLAVPKTPFNSLSSQSTYNNSTSCIQAN